MNDKIRWTLSISKQERDELKEVYYDTVKQHRLSFSAWALKMMRHGIRVPN